ncbi:hypothetical protein H1R20_g12149, partial [Candolleomyces eurysporus]
MSSKFSKSLWRKTSKPKEEQIVHIPPPPPDIDPVTLVVIGCGDRGKIYSEYAVDNPYDCKVVSIAEPRAKTRQAFAQRHSIDQSLVFANWEELLAASEEVINTIGKRLADAVLVTVQDHLHLAVATAFAKQGYHILCEKPMATTVDACIEMAEAVKEAGVIFAMGHGEAHSSVITATSDSRLCLPVMRYSPYTQEIRAIISSGSLGELVNAVHVEPVGYYHFAHSFVRGNWRNERESSFSLLTKCCQ